VPSDDMLALAREHGTAVVSSPLDTYVSARMVTLAAPCRALMDREPLTAGPEDLLSEVSDQVKNVHYGAALAVDAARRPIGVVTRSDLVRPTPRRVLLVDHAEQAQSVPGVEEAEIVEILDHHHVGSIETTVPVTATFDPVGSTATLVIERFRHNGMEPSRPTATMLLGAILSDTVILNSPTTTERDRSVVEYLGRVLAIDAMTFGRQMFEETSDVSRLPAEEIISRDAKAYEAAGGKTIAIAQVETVGGSLLARKDELRAALDAGRERNGYSVFALMVTDILSNGTELLAVGDRAPLERAFGPPSADGLVSLPGVMSRKKQVAPALLDATAR
jgi:manganese-dependent inorganic pyrophosphatase